MDCVKLGKKIKEARLAKKMTQSDVVGDFITRNMLSQIESGTASPSIKTLEYLSKVLEISMHSLMPSAEEEGSVENAVLPGESETLLEQLLQSKNAIKSKNFKDALQHLENLANIEALQDECSALLAHCNLGLANRYASENNYKTAAMHAKKASELASVGIYASREIKTSALLILDDIASRIEQENNHVLKF